MGAASAGACSSPVQCPSQSVSTPSACAAVEVGTTFDTTGVVSLFNIVVPVFTFIGFTEVDCTVVNASVWAPDTTLHFAPFLSTHFFPCLIQNGPFLSVVALVSMTPSDSNPRPSAENRSNLATMTIELPEYQERVS